MCGSQQDCVSACVYHKKNNSIFLAVRLIDVEVVVMLRTDLLRCIHFGAIVLSHMFMCFGNLIDFAYIRIF